MVDNLAYPSAGGVGFRNLPADTAANDIHGNTTEPASTAMANSIDQLRHIVPSPQDLKPVWPLLANGTLDATQLTSVLDQLDSLANQSQNSAARVCQ